jgi:molybdenum cofactor guanylyltransferase
VADRELSGVLLVGGASTRFGSPKALARFRGETLAERAWNLLGAVCEERIAVGKPGLLDLPFDVLDDGTTVRAPIAGALAGLRAARHDVCLVVPVDMPMLTPDALRTLAASCRDVAHPPPGPLPGAYRRSSALPALERAFDAERFSLRDAIAELDVAIVDLDDDLLVNVNTPDDVQRL